MNDLEDFMDIAIEEAKLSMKEGNSGFGAVVIKNTAFCTVLRRDDCTGEARWKLHRSLNF